MVFCGEVGERTEHLLCHEDSGGFPEEDWGRGLERKEVCGDEGSVTFQLTVYVLTQGMGCPGQPLLQPHHHLHVRWLWSEADDLHVGSSHISVHLYRKEVGNDQLQC